MTRAAWAPGWPYPNDDPERLRVVADVATGNALVVWEDQFDGLMLLDYRNGAWGSIRGIWGEALASMACDGSRCGLLTQDSGLNAVVYNQADGSVSASELDTSSSDWRAPQLVGTAQGLHAVWRSVPTQESVTLWYRRLPPGSTTWNAPVKLVSSTSTRNVHGSPKIAAAVGGELRVLWTEAPPMTTDADLISRTRNPTTGSWSTPEVVRRFPPATDDHSLRVAYLGGRNVQLIYRSSSGYVARRYSGGSWQPEVDIDTVTNGTPNYYDVHLLTTTSGRALYIANEAYRPRFNLTTNGSWGTARNLPMSGMTGGSGRQQIAGAPDGSALAIWVQYHRGVPLLYGRFRTAGGGWQASAWLSAVGTSVNVARVAYAGGGRYAVVWKDGDGKVYARSFNAASQSWTAKVAADSKVDFGPALGMASDGNGRVMAAWYDPYTTAGHRVTAAVYDVAAASWGPVAGVNDADVSVSSIAIASDQANRFMLAWREPSHQRIRARRYNAGTWGSWIATLDSSGGNPQAWEKTEVSLASAGAGQFMACWQGVVAGGSNRQLRCARHNAGTWAAYKALDDLPIYDWGEVFGTPQVIADNGGYVAAWRRCDASNHDYTVRAARYAGSWQVPSALYAATTAAPCDNRDAALPTIARDGAGNLLVTWTTGDIFVRPDAYAASYYASQSQWTAAESLESGVGGSGSVRATGRPGAGFDVLWVQDDGERYAIHAQVKSVP